MMEVKKSLQGNAVLIQYVVQSRNNYDAELQMCAEHRANSHKTQAGVNAFDKFDPNAPFELKIPQKCH